MAVTKLVCPHCEAALKFAAALDPGTDVSCPRCEDTFTVGAVEAAPARKSSKAVRAAAPNEADESPRKKKRKKRRVDRGGALLMLGVLAGLLVLGGAIWAVIWLARGKKTEEPAPTAHGSLEGEKKPDPPRPAPPDPGTGGNGGTGDKGGTGGDKAPPEKDPPQGDPTSKPPEPYKPPERPKEKPFLTLDPGGHTAVVRRVFFSKDGKKVYTTSLDRSVRVWDAGTGECLSVIRLPAGVGREGGIQFADLSPDNNLMAVAPTPYEDARAGGLLYLLSLQTGQITRAIRTSETVTAVAYSPNGQWLAVSLAGGYIHVLDAKSDKQIGEFEGHRDGIPMMAWSPDSRLLATASRDSTACLWSPASVKPVAVLKKHKSACISVAWHPSGKSLATGGDDGQVCFWSSTGQALKSYPCMERDKEGKDTAVPVALTTLAFSKSGKDLLFGGVGTRGVAGVLDPATGKQRLVTDHHTDTVQYGTVSPDGLLALTTGGAHKETCLWKLSDGELQAKFQAPSSSHWGVGWSADGKSIAWGGDSHGSPLLGTTPLEQAFSLETLEPTGKPEGRYTRNPLAAGDARLDVSNSRKFAVLRPGKQTVFLTPSNSQDRAYSAALLSADRAVVGGTFGAMYLFDTTTGQQLKVYKAHASEVTGIAVSPDGKYFITASTDQTLRVWTQDRNEPVLSLFVAGSEWIAWTPEGYYAASGGGDRLMGWQVNNGLAATGTYYSAVQFRASLYQPEAVKLVLKEGSLEKALAKAGVSNQVQVGEVLPPKVEIVTPKPAAEGAVEVKHPTLEVKAIATSAGTYPITSMRLLVDGRPYLGNKGVKTFTGKLLQTEGVWNVALPPGQHTLTVLAESQVSKGVSPTLEVERSSGKEELPNLYILAVGVSEYPGKLKLNYSASDADLIVQTFQKKTKGVFNTVEVKLLRDRAATKQSIMEGMNWMASKMSPLDVGIFFFSGHGARDDQGRFFLVPVDVSNAPPEQWGVPGEFVKDTLGNMPGRLIAMLDACHSGSVAELFKPGKSDGLVRDLMADEYGVVVLCSSLSSEYSLESSTTKAGFFTRGIVEGMSGKADFNHDNLIHLSELSLYSSLRVQQLSRGEQNPTMGRPPQVKSFVVGKP